MESAFDPIVAPITASGGAVGIVRISGKGSLDIARQFCTRIGPNYESHRATFVTFKNGEDGLLLPFLEGSGYTGEESVELHMHGSRAALESATSSLVVLGARHARPGEFSERAFLNGKLDLSMAEGVNATVRAQSERQLRLAERLRAGSASQQADVIRSEVTTVVAAIEASTDFSEEIGDVDATGLVTILEQAENRCAQLIESAQYVDYTLSGIRVAILGPPNAGKSSLLNRILGIERAIVSDIEGTTRDYIEETVIVSGVPIVLVDTAGLRQSEDDLEQAGIDRSRLEAKKADLIWYVTEDGSPCANSFGVETWLVRNKCDLDPPGKATQSNALAVSAFSGDGVADLLNATAIHFAGSGDYPLVCSARHGDCFRAAAVAIRGAIEGFEFHHPVDLVVTHLREVVYQMGLIDGQTAATDLLDKIFSEFCIGK